MDFFLAAKLGKSGADHLREWIRNGSTATLRVNSVAVLSKMSIPADIPMIIEALETDEKVRLLSIASEVSKLMRYDWETCLSIAKDPKTVPHPRKLAKLLAKEAVHPSDVECRWCGSYLLRELVAVL